MWSLEICRTLLFIFIRDQKYRFRPSERLKKEKHVRYLSFPVRAACWRFWWRSSQITPSFTEPAPFSFQFSGHSQWSSCELDLILAAMLLTLTVTVSVTCCSSGTGFYWYANLAVFISLLEIKRVQAEKQHRLFWPCPVDEGIHFYFSLIWAMVKTTNIKRKLRVELKQQVQKRTWCSRDGLFSNHPCIYNIPDPGTV